MWSDDSTQQEWVKRLQSLGFNKVCVLTADMRVICSSDKKDEPKLWFDEQKNSVSEHEVFSQDWNKIKVFTMFHTKFDVHVGTEVNVAGSKGNCCVVARKTKNFIVVASGVTHEGDVKENRTAPFDDAAHALKVADKKLFKEIYVQDAIAKGGDDTKARLEALYKKSLEGQDFQKEKKFDVEKIDSLKGQLLDDSIGAVEQGIKDIQQIDGDGMYKYTVSLTLIQPTTFRKLSSMMTPETDYGNTAQFQNKAIACIADFRIFRRSENF